MVLNGRGEAVRIGNAEPSAARCSGLRLDCRVEGSLPSYYQAQGSRSPLLLIGSRWVFALRDGFLNPIFRITA